MNTVFCTEELLNDITRIEKFRSQHDENYNLNTLLKLYSLLQNTLKIFEKINDNIIAEIKTNIQLFPYLSDMVIIYCEISTFNPHIDIYYHYAEHMNNVSDSLYFHEQNRQCQIALVEQNRINSFISQIQEESDENKLEIRNAIPFKDARIKEEYKKKIIFSDITIHDNIMEFLDMYTYTNHADEYYSYLYQREELANFIFSFS